MTSQTAESLPPYAPVTVGVRMLNQQTRKVLDLVRAGHPVIITDHGQSIARIVPEGLSPLEQIIAGGRYLGSVDATLVPPPSNDLADRPATSTSLDEIRSDRT